MRPSTAGILAAALALGFAAAPPSPAGAQGLAKGTVEFAPSFSLAHMSQGHSGATFLSAGVSFGFCITSTLEPRFELGLEHLSSGGFSSSGGRGLAGLAINFPASGRTVPFISVAIGAESQGPGTLILPELGVGTRVLVGNSASANLGLKWERHPDDRTDLQILSINLGVSMLLNRRE